MSAACYEASIQRLLKSEGGYVNHPSDPGGPTNFGITIHDYRKHAKPDATASDLRAMRVEEARAIYRAKYWDAMRCDALPAGVDYCVFDYAVNSGTGRAPKVVQRILGVAVTGVMDEATLTQVRACEPVALINAICDERLRFLQGLRTWPVFGAGWARRVGNVRATALAMAANTAAPDRSARSTGKGVAPLNDRARNSTAGGAIASGGLVAQQAAEGGAHWIAVAAIVVAAIAITIGLVAFWRWHRRPQQDAPAEFEQAFHNRENDMDWTHVATKLVTLGAPMLGSALGGPLGGMAGKLVADAFGAAAATPDAVHAAITDKSADLKIAAEAAQKAESEWMEALAEIGKTQVNAVGETMRAEAMSGDLLQRWWRPLYALELSLIECPAFALTVLHALWIGHEIGINGLASLSGLLMTYFAARFGVLGVYVNGRSREKQAALTGEGTPSIVGAVVKAVTRKR